MIIIGYIGEHMITLSIIIATVGLIGAIKMCQYFHICQVGFHDKVKVKYMSLVDLVNEEKLVYKGYLDVKQFIWKMFSEHSHSRKYDYVCIKCGKCFSEIEETREHINKLLIDNLKAQKEKHERKKIATDFYNENCKGVDDGLE